MKHFISNLQLRHKFALIGSLVTLMVALPTWLAIQASFETLAVSRAEVSGIEPAGATLSLIQLVQQHRGQSAMVLAGNETVAADRRAKQTAVDQALSQVKAALGSLSATPLDERLAAVQRQWQPLAAAVGAKSMSGPESFAQHTELVGMAFGLLEGIVDSSKLALDPQANTYYLVSSVLGHLPRLTESLGQMRAQGPCCWAREKA